eukprot:535553_1
MFLGVFLQNHSYLTLLLICNLLDVINASFSLCDWSPSVDKTTIIFGQKCITINTNAHIGEAFLQNAFDVPYSLIIGFRRYDDTLFTLDNNYTAGWRAFASGHILTLDLSQNHRLKIYQSSRIDTSQNVLDSDESVTKSKVEQILNLHSDGDYSTENFLMVYTELDDISLLPSIQWVSNNPTAHPTLQPSVPSNYPSNTPTRNHFALTSNTSPDTSPDTFCTDYKYIQCIKYSASSTISQYGDMKTSKLVG